MFCCCVASAVLLLQKVKYHAWFQLNFVRKLFNTLSNLHIAMPLEENLAIVPKIFEQLSFLVYVFIFALITNRLKMLMVRNNILKWLILYFGLWLVWLRYLSCLDFLKLRQIWVSQWPIHMNLFLTMTLAMGQA